MDILKKITGYSGTTGVACKNLNRKYILIEKEPEYIDIINKRLTNYEIHIQNNPSFYWTQW